MERTYIKDLKANIGKEVIIKGWIDVRRDHGKLIFIDVRDYSGKIQAVALPNNKEAHDASSKVRSEWVVAVTGIVNKRPDKMVSKNEDNGTIELEIKKLEILNESLTPPFDVSADGRDINEDVKTSIQIPGST
jgi:aspartyl-tRNA synthetase